jgi:predicted acyltransferase
LGYFLLFLVARGPQWLAPTAIGVILVGYWVAFAANPPAEDFDYQAVGVPLEWTEHQTGFASAWNKNSNLAWRFDTWFLNLFPRPEPFLFHGGGYSTLSFVPTLATMLMGLLAGRWLLNEPGTGRRLCLLAAAVVVGLSTGWLLNEFDICPQVKRIWTPSFALWSGGWCFLFVFVFHLVCDVWQLKSWSFPLVVIGSNCIFVYLLNWTIKGSIISALHRHFGTAIFEIQGPAFTELLTGLAVLAIFWVLLFWMYRNKIFVKL